MTMGVRDVALWCAVVAVVMTTAATYSVDCNHEYPGCNTKLRNMADEDEEAIASQQLSDLTLPPFFLTSATIPTKVFPETARTTTDSKGDVDRTIAMFEINDPMLKPKLRLPRSVTSEPKNKDISDKFNSNRQTPFNPLLTINTSDEIKMCKENETMYKVGEHIDRGCEETCECTATGVFDCSPRCQLPYRRRVGRLTDPLCFESPVDECCAVIACASGTGKPKSTTIEMCRYGNEAHPVGVKWHIGCEQTCVCEGSSTVTCKPRCNRLPLSDKCINVQDPNDECCEVQVCDESSGAHKKPGNITISSSLSSGTTTSSTYKSPNTSSTTNDPMLKPKLRLPRLITSRPKNKDISDKINGNLLITSDSMPSINRSDEMKMCKENETMYKVGEHIDRGCEETCECNATGVFDCSPRCEHPYVRRDRRLTDPYCDLSPVNECCALIACSSGSGKPKSTTIEMCRYGNEAHPVGVKWHIGCEQTCVCEGSSTVTCKPRCNRLPLSDKCINVQDPNDECCEVQVCDESSGAHKKPGNITISSSLSSGTTTSSTYKSPNTSSTTNDPMLKPKLRLPRLITSRPKNKDISDKINGNLLITSDSMPSINRSDEMKMCKENETMYKVGEHIDRGCEETCECNATGVFDCSPRCEHPYVRRDRRLTDPYCDLSPVNECCALIACSSGSGKPKSTTIEMCRYGNEAHPVGVKWHIGCEQTCVCEGSSTVTCKPRCNRLPLSDKCINVQDPNDECCEVQVCDESSGAHKKPGNITISSSLSSGTTTSSTYKSPNTSSTTNDPMLKPKLRLPRLITSRPKNKDISDKINGNLLITSDSMPSINRSDEMKMCKENETMYKVGEHIDRGCEETCECNATGVFDCSPRCEHPYVRRDRRLTDPYCDLSSVNECCALIACSSGSGKPKSTTIEMCRYGNEAYSVGVQWHIGCEQTCVCEDSSTVTCKPRCNRLPLSDKCINIQDPNDECCEVQVCDESSGAHEKPGNITISSSLSSGTTNSTRSGSTTPVTSSTYKSPNTSSTTNDPVLKPKLRLPRLITSRPKDEDISDKINRNLLITSNPVPSINRSDEMKMCKENETMYKVGEHIDRGCEETCECNATGVFDCSPRCEHPYVPRDRRLTDPYCHLSPVNECCALIACSSGSGKPKSTTIEMCRYGNEAYPVGVQWHIGCELTCICKGSSTVTCKPRCNRLPLSDKCINVQDPSDECCEVQVCDESSGAHEKPGNITTSTNL